MNNRSLVLEATALQTAPQLLPRLSFIVACLLASSSFEENSLKASKWFKKKNTDTIFKALKMSNKSPYLELTATKLSSLKVPDKYSKDFFAQKEAMLTLSHKNQTICTYFECVPKAEQITLVNKIYNC